MKMTGKEIARCHKAILAFGLILMASLSPATLRSQSVEAGVSSTSRLLEIWRLYWDNGKEAALVLAKQTAARDSRNPDAFFFSNLIEAIGNPWFDAEAFAKQYVSLLRTKADVMRFGGMLCLWVFKDEQAAEFFKKAVWLDPADAVAHSFLGLAYYRMSQKQAGAMQYNLPEDLRRARQSLETATNLDPRNAMAYFYLGNVLFKMGQTEAAQRAYEKALAIEPANWHARLNYGSIMIRLRQKDDALKQVDYLQGVLPAKQELWATYRQAFEADLELFRF